MARPLRTDFEGAWHHVMHRGRRKEPTFRSDADRYDFLELLERIHGRFGVEINAFALMGNHYHLLVHTPEGQLSRAMQYLDGVYTQRFNRRYGLDGSLFRGRFTSKLVDTDGYLSDVVRYIHRNPRGIGFEDRLPDYSWSSYPIFLQVIDGAALPDWLSTQALWANGVFSARELRRRTEGPAKEDELDPDDFPTAIGSSSFINAALSQIKVDVETIDKLRAAVPRPGIPDIQRAIQSAMDNKAQGLRLGAHERKLVSLGLAQELGGLTLTELATEFSYASPQSAGNAAFKFRERQREPGFALAVEHVRSEIAGLMVDERCR